MITTPDPSPLQEFYLDKTIFSTHNSNYTGEDMPDGMDYQGIQWKTNMRHLPRKILRQHRNASYKPFKQFKEKETTHYPQKHIKKEEPYYSFEKFYKISDLWYGHFQLKDNLMVPTKTDLLYPYASGFIHYSLLNFKEKRFAFPGNLHPVGIDYHENIVGLSGLEGNVLLYDMQNDKTLASKTVISDNSINNCVNFFKQKGLNHLKLCCGGNDNSLQILDLFLDLKVELRVEMDSPVNNIKPSPDGKLLLVLSDQEEADIIDPKSGKTIIELHGHEDYGFAGDWHPDGHYIATGNQDCTCRVWDIRKPDREVNILQSHLGNVSTVKYSNTGSYLAVAENIDFVNIYNVDSVYEEMQVIDFFGEVTGVSFDGEDGESLMFGVMLNGYNGVFEYNVRKTEHLSVLSSMMF